MAAKLSPKPAAFAASCSAVPLNDSWLRSHSLSAPTLPGFVEQSSICPRSASG